MRDPFGRTETTRRLHLVGMVALLLGIALAAGASAAPESIEVRELRLELKETRLALESRVDGLQRDRNLLGALFGAGVVTLTLAYFRWLRKADELAKARLEKIIASRPTALMELLDEHDAEQRLRCETRVTVVSEALDLERVLRQHGFRKVVTIDGERAAAEVGETGAVVFDLVRGVDEKQATAIIEEQNLVHVLAFCFGRANLPPGKATFANSHMTLFSRLLELLKFQDAAARG